MKLRLVVASVLALGSSALGDSLSTREVCKTGYGSRSLASVRTSTAAVLHYASTVVAVVTSTPTRFMTPAPGTTTSTSTRTSTVRVGTISTNTQTSTLTSTSTITSVSVSTTTTTLTSSTTTTTSTTTTILPSAGFTAIGDEPGFHLRKRSPAQRRADLVERATATAKPAIPVLGTQAALAAATVVQYPQTVVCTDYVTTIRTSTRTVLAPTSTSTLPKSTITRVSTVTVRTIIPVVIAVRTISTTTTEMQTTQVTTTSTSTETTSTTTTIVAPTATFYAQCAANNIVSSYQGQQIGYYTFNAAFTLQSFFPQDKSGYGCCAMCAQTPNCAGYAQLLPDGACYYLTTDGRCDGQQSFADEFHYYPVAGTGYTIGNGACGFLKPVAGHA